MIVRYLFVAFLVLHPWIMKAQNLMRNPGFEEVTDCNLTTITGITATYWSFASLEGASQNYHACSTDASFSVPKNINGFQKPLSGNGYGGLFLFSSIFTPPVTYREYLQGTFVKPLEAGKVYAFTCFFSLPDYNPFPTDRMGIYFSKDKVRVEDYGVLPFTPQIVHPGVFLADSVNWVKYEGSFKATGGEKHLLIGNFSSDEDTPILYDTRVGISIHYYIDDVSLYECNKLVELGSDTTICAGETYVLNAFTQGATYQWQDTSTASTYTVKKEGMYWVEVYKDNCHTKDSIYVALKDPTFSLGQDTTLCQGEALTIKAAGVQPPYTWSNGVEQATITVTTSGKYWLRATVNGCQRTDTIQVTFEEPARVFLGNDTTLCYGEVLTLTAWSPGATYRWNDASEQASLEVRESGDYSVKVKRAACEDEGKIKVTFFDCARDIPNVITPNDDNKNETLVIKEIRNDLWSLEIMNRWGKLVYQNTNYRNEWDGRGCSPGVYFYYLVNLASHQKYKGWVQILK